LPGFTSCEAREDGKAHGDNKKGCESECEAGSKNGASAFRGGVPKPPKRVLLAQIFCAFEGAFAKALDVSLGRLDLGSFAEKFAKEFVRRYGRLHFAE
jgi:hypothetical protein